MHKIIKEDGRVMDDVERRLSLVSFNPAVEKQIRDEDEPNPLTLAYKRNSKVVLGETIAYAKDCAEKLHIPPSSSCVDAIKTVLFEDIDFKDPHWREQEDLLADTFDAVGASVRQINEFGGEFFKDGKVPDHVMAAAILTDCADPDAPYHHKTAKKIFLNAYDIWDRYGKGYEKAGASEKLVFLNMLKNDMDCSKAIYKHTNANYTPMAKRYIHSYAPIAKHLTNETAFERHIQDNLKYMRDVLARLLPPTEIHKLQTEHKHEPSEGQENNIPLLALKGNKVAKTRIEPAFGCDHILYDDPKEKSATSAHTTPPQIGADTKNSDALEHHWGQSNSISPSETLDSQKKNLIDGIMSRLKIRTLTPYGERKVQDILETRIDFNDPDWQKDIHDYTEVTDDIESAIGMIRDYGSVYFKDRQIPPSVFITALSLEYSKVPDFPYAEKKIQRAVSDLTMRFGQNLDAEKPQTQLVFLNYIKNEIDLDMGRYFADPSEDAHQELEMKFLHFFAPVAKNLKQETDFEQAILDRIDEVESVLAMSEAPKAEYINFMYMKALARPPEKEEKVQHTTTRNGTVAKTKIMPNEINQHILFE